MGICNDDCDCLVTGDRGILVTGTGDADTPYIVSPDSSRNVSLIVSTRDDLPTLTNDDIGTFAYVGDTGITFVWFGGEWEPIGNEWSRADFTDLDFAVAPTDSTGFVLAGAGAFAVWAKGWVDASIDADGNGATFSVDLVRKDTGAVLDSIETRAFNNDVADQPAKLPFSLLATIGLGTPADVTGIVLTFWAADLASDTTGVLKNGRIFAQRISPIDTTTAYP